MRKLLLICCIFAYSQLNAQSYSNFESVGQRALSIFQSLDYISEDDFVEIFQPGLNAGGFSYTEKVEANNAYREFYRDIKQESRNSGMRWSNIQFVEFYKYPVEEEGGITCRVGVLRFSYKGEIRRRKIVTILKDGRYYLLRM